MKALKLFDVLSVGSPGLTSVQKTGKHSGFVDFDLCLQLDILVIHHTRSESAEGLADFANALDYLFV